MASFDKAYNFLTSWQPELRAGYHAADFAQAAENVLTLEGKYTDNPNDNGNWTGGKKGVGELVGTNYGISAPAWAQYHGKMPTRADMLAITPAIAKKIYRANYWNKVRGNEIKDQQVAEILFDALVNQTGKTGVMIQDTLAAMGKNVPVSVSTTKALSNDAVTAINEADQKAFFEKFKAKRLEYYNSLAQRDSAMRDFLQGWKNRMAAFTYSATEKAKSVWRVHKPAMIAGAVVVFTVTVIAAIHIYSSPTKKSDG